MTKKQDQEQAAEKDEVQAKYEAEALAEQKAIDEAAAKELDDLDDLEAGVLNEDVQEPASDEVVQLRAALTSLLVKGASSPTGQWATLTVPAEAVAAARALLGLGSTPDASNTANPA